MSNKQPRAPKVYLAKTLFRQVLETVVFREDEAKGQIILPPDTTSYVGDFDELRTFLPASCDLLELSEDETVGTQVERLLQDDPPSALFIAVEESSWLALRPPYDAAQIDESAIPQEIFDDEIDLSAALSSFSEDHILFENFSEQDHLNYWVFKQKEMQKEAVETAAQVLPAGSLLATIVPDYILLGWSYITEIDALRFVITLPFGSTLLWRLVTRPELFPASLVVWSIGGQRQAPMRFFKAPPLDDDISVGEIISDLEKLCGQDGGTTKYGFVRREGVPPLEQTWRYDAHDPQLQKSITDMQALGEVKTLGDLAEIFKGAGKWLRNSDWSVPSTQTPDVGVPLLEDGDVPTLLGFPSGDRLTHVFPAQMEETVPLQPGDICLGSYYYYERVKITPEMLPLLAGESIIVIRPNRDVDPDFLFVYLNSQRARAWIEARDVTNLERLIDLPVPVPDETMRTATDNLKRAIEELDELRSEAQRALHTLFDAESVIDQRLHFLSTGRRIRQRLHAARQVDDFDYRVRTGFPHPLAYRWRTIGAAQPDLQGYLYTLNTAEVTACYLATIAILLAQAVDDFQIGYLDTLKQKFAQSRHGISFGDWIAILREVRGAKVLKRTSDYIPFYEVSRFLDDEQVDMALQVLKDSRDRQAHGKGAEGLEIAARFEESRKALRTVLQAVEFLSDYALRNVEDTRRDALSKVTRYSYRELMGDHPVVPLAEGETGESEIEQNSLYLVDRNGELHLLRPLLARRRCPTCGRWATFHLDSYDPKADVVTLKAMEHAHTIDDANIANAFRHLGLLPVDQ